MEEFNYFKKDFSEEELIEIAKKRIKVKRELFSHIAAYIFVNAFILFVYWLINEKIEINITFWPGWVLSGWGLGLLFHIFEAMQELNFKYNANAINKELAKIKKQINDRKIDK